LLDRQKRDAQRLRREVMGADDSLRHPYFRSLERQLAGDVRVVNREELLAAAARSDIVYVGDFHARVEYQRFAADLLSRLAHEVPRIALGIEFVYARQQRLLDRRQEGAIDDEELLRRMHYREEWGYPWEGYRTILDSARDAGMPVHALDAPPRGGFEGLGERDQHAARRIRAILTGDPHTRLIVFYGEAHLARSHLPRRVRTLLKRAGAERSELTVFQSPDRIYWRLLERAGGLPGAVRVDESTYAVFHVGPLEKYEAYRQVLERWHGDLPHDEEVDLTPAMHHIIELLLGWIGIRAHRRRVRHRAGWSEDLIDAFPEVYSGGEAEALLAPILEEHGRSEGEILEARGRLRDRGAIYDSRSNTVFLDRYLPGSAAAEAARFLRAALTGRLFVGPEEPVDDVASTAYLAAYGEALAQLGSRFVDPTAEAPAPDADSAGVAAGWLDAHRHFERSRRLKPPDDLVGPLRASRPLRRLLALDLGRRLGRKLFERVRGGGLDQKGVRRLFTQPLSPDRAAARVLRLLRNP
jgi:hypothetical protein